MLKTDIVLLGATGFTGSLIANELNTQNLTFRAFARNIEKLNRLKSRNSNCISAEPMHWNHNELGLNLGSNSIVINCIGPFNVYGSKIVDTCIQAGATYLDITGEQEFVKQSFEAKNELAIEKGALIVHSMAFESALSDIMLKMAMNQIPANNFISYNTYYLLNSKQMSPGTRISMKVSNAFQSYRLINSTLHSIFEIETNIPKCLDPIEPFACVPVGYPEVLFAKIYGNIRNACSHYLVEANSDFALLWRTKNSDSHNSIDVTNLIKRHDQLTFSGPSIEDRFHQKFEIHSYLTSNRNQFKQILSGNDMYGLTAELIVHALLVIKNQLSETSNLRGIFTPSQLLGEMGENFITSHPKIELYSKLLENDYE